MELVLAPEIALEENRLRDFLAKKLKLDHPDDAVIRKLRQSIDARSQKVKVNLKVEVFAGETPPGLVTQVPVYKDVSDKPTAVIVGAGPAGLFAALRLIEQGIKPVILERGKDVQSRRRDLAALNKEHVVNPDSNYCFGEGGAGTYSDGKLYTRSDKRGNLRKILEIMVAHGAREEILYDAHPHIGTNKLPPLMVGLRERILECGGEVHFDTRVTGLLIRENTICGVTTADGKEFTGIGVILATGHSARDIYDLLHKNEILIESKPFALGVRIEHPQTVIDRIQYHCETDRGPYLPAAAYSLVTQTYVKNVKRGVFSFCMCPGGFIVPAATAPGEIVVNGMSPSRRDSQWANSGMVVEITEKDLQKYSSYGPLAGLQFQKEVEQKACQMAGNRQAAPAQLALDFIRQKFSGKLNNTSYQPGLETADLYEVLPDFVSGALKEGLKDFGRKMKNYLSNEAQLIGVESRTSSPVRIPRDKESCEHPQIAGLFPCGEGAGYAGGIMSAAMDGERCADALAGKYA